MALEMALPKIEEMRMSRLAKTLSASAEPSTLTEMFLFSSFPR